MNKKILVTLFPGCAAYEVMTAIEVLAPKYTIEIATPDGTEHKSPMGLTFNANKSYKDINIDDYDCILMPGGNCESVIDNKELGEIIVKANEKKLIIGAICSGPLNLAKAGILKGRSYTHAAIYLQELAHVWDGGNFVKEDVVIDGNIITAQPHGHIDFAIELGKRLGLFEKNPGEAEGYRNYLKGECAVDWSKIGVYKE